jgi:hypothetical protein
VFPVKYELGVYITEDDEIMQAAGRGHSKSDNETVRSIGQGEARHRKYKRLKLGGGHLYDRSGV